MQHSWLSVALACSLAACGGRHAPKSSEKGPPAVDWEESRLFDAPNGEKALVGPLLRSPRHVDMTTITSRGVSERCYLIALGVPYLEPPFDETARGFVVQGSPFDVGWEPQDRGAPGACSEAFGNGFRLPTLTEAQAAFEMSVLSRRAATSVLVINDDRGIATVIFEPKPSEPGCHILDPSCDWHVEFETNRERSGLLYCVGPASSLPAQNPSDVEVRQCVRRVSSEVARLDRARIVRMVPEAELDLVFRMRRACTTQKDSEFDTIGETLRDSAGDAALRPRLVEMERALAHATRGLTTVRDAASEKGEAADCEELGNRYWKTCATESCLPAQVRYARHCLGSDPSERMRRITEELAARVTELERAVPRLRTHAEIGEEAARCVKDPGISRRFAALLGERPTAPPAAPPCLCPIEDLECGISTLLEPEQCPSSPRSGGAAGACGCAKNDLSCSMKCAE